MTHPPVRRPRRRHLLTLVSVLALALGTAAGASAAPDTATSTSSDTRRVAAPKPKAARPATVVSLTFDDSLDSQMVGAQALDMAGIDGTFYAVSSWVDKPGYLTRADLTSLRARGHEIGGHTKTHRDLAQIPDGEVTRQICNDRTTLQDWGFRPTSFAYPFASTSSAAEAAVTACGYDTGRGLGDVRSPDSCADCPVAESLPPADPALLAAPDQVDATWSLTDLKKRVTDARNGGGGWVVLTFHNVCTSPGSSTCPASQSIRPATLTAFTVWLRLYTLDPRNATSTATVGDAYRASVGSAYPGYQTASDSPAPEPAPIGTNAIVNPGLETTGADGMPDCFDKAGYGTNTPVWASAPGRTGIAQRITISGYQDGDAKLLPTMDLGTCSPSVTPGRSYDLGTWYTATGITQFALYYRTGAGEWRYWTSSPWFPPAEDWTRATWTTPPVPADGTAVSFGLALIADGTVVTDDYSMVDPG